MRLVALAVLLVFAGIGWPASVAAADPMEVLARVQFRAYDARACAAYAVMNAIGYDEEHHPARAMHRFRTTTREAMQRLPEALLARMRALRINRTPLHLIVAYALTTEGPPNFTPTFSQRGLHDVLQGLDTILKEVWSAGLATLCENSKNAHEEEWRKREPSVKAHFTDALRYLNVTSTSFYPVRVLVVTALNESYDRAGNTFFANPHGAFIYAGPVAQRSDLYLLEFLDILQRPLLSSSVVRTQLERTRDLFTILPPNYLPSYPTWERNYPESFSRVASAFVVHADGASRQAEARRIHCNGFPAALHIADALGKLEGSNDSLAERYLTVLETLDVPAERNRWATRECK